MNRLVLAALATISVAALAGCAAPEQDDGLVQVVASTDVYGDIASVVGGDLVEVTSIIDDPSQDPHSFEGDVRVQLALSRADVVIENGGGYDDFVATLLAGTDNEGAAVVNVSDVSGYAQGEGFNEHLWYDFPTMERLADELVTRLSDAAPDGSSAFRSNADQFIATIDLLEEQEAGLSERVSGTGVAITEPVPNYLLAASGFVIVTPDEFSESIEEGTDVSPLVLQETLDLFPTGQAALLVYNDQTTGPQTEAVLAAAEAAGVPVVPVSETLPEGESYLTWMTATLEAIEEGVA